MKKEIWKKIEGYPNYEVSNKGNIRSIDMKVRHPLGGLRRVKGRILKKNVVSSGYHGVCLTKRKTVLVHRVVAFNHIPNPNNYPCVNHIDGDKQNNNVSNLQWCTYSMNERHSYDVLGKVANKSNLGNTGIKSASAKPVAEICDKGKILHVWGSASEAARELNTLQSRISCVCRGETVNGKHRGMRFKYITKPIYKRFFNAAEG